jgi:parvulin-like peptidyl-prolyl isomerase
MIRLALVALALVGCGASTASVATSNSSSDANFATQATEPRANDPTAAKATSGPATAGTAVKLGGGKKPPTATSEEPPPAFPMPGEGGEAAKPTSTVEPTKISARHVLVQWMGSDRAGKSVLRTREQALVLAQEVLKRAKAGEDLGRLAVEYSDEPNAGPRGGSLGRFGKGQMVGAFEAVAFKLKVGQISDIVETPFGYHIIQRTE